MITNHDGRQERRDNQTECNNTNKNRTSGYDANKNDNMNRANNMEHMNNNTDDMNAGNNHKAHSTNDMDEQKHDNKY